MFKGFSKEFQEFIQEINQKPNSSVIVFNTTDLEEVMADKEKKEVKCAIIPSDLKELIGSSFITFCGRNYMIKSHSYWVQIRKKEDIPRKIENDVLRLVKAVDYDVIMSISSGVLSNFDNAYSRRFLINVAEKETQTLKLKSYCLSSVQEINAEVQKLRTTHRELMLDYLFILPDDCHCEVKPTGHPDNDLLYECHIEKCLDTPEKVSAFKDEIITQIHHKAQLLNHKKQVIQEISNYSQNKGLTETELDNTLGDEWKENLKSLLREADVNKYKEKTFELIDDKVVENQQKAEERVRKEEQFQQELNQKKDQSITEITATLDQEPKLINSELSTQYQNWEEQIKQLTDIQQLANFQERLLVDIQARRKEKEASQKVKNNLNKLQTGTQEEKDQAWKDLENQETEKGYNENKEEIETLKKQQATENPEQYSEEAKKRIEEKLKENRVKEDELNDENQQNWQKLKKGEIKDPDQLVVTETKIKENIYQKEVEKKITNLTERVNKILKSNLPILKSQIKTLKEELLAFINNSNIYYSNHKDIADKLLTSLESKNEAREEVNGKDKDKNNFPTGWVVGGGIAVVIGLGALLVIRNQKKKRR